MFCSMNRRPLLRWLWILFVAACATTQPVRPPNSMRIVTNGRRAVAALKTKACGDADAAFASVPDSAIAPDTYYTLPLIEGCVELIALGADGQILGRQSNLRMLPGSSWTIR